MTDNLWVPPPPPPGTDLREQIEDKRRRGPRETPKDDEYDPIHTANMLLAGWAAVLRKDEEFMAVMRSIPRAVRRELARRFAYLLTSERDTA